MKFVSVCGQSFFETPVSGGDFLNYELLKSFPDPPNAYLIINDISFPYAKANLMCNILPIKDFFNLNRLVQKYIFLVPIGFLNSLLKITRYLKNFKEPLILYSPGDFICNVIPMVMYKNRFPESKIIVRIHHLNEPPLKRKGNSFFSSVVSFILQRASLALINKNADLVLLLNEGVKNALIKMRFSSERLVVIGAGADLGKIRALKDVKRENKIIYLGRLSRTKGIFDLPRILSLVLKNMPDARLQLIGFTNEKIADDLKREFSKAGVLGNVDFLGHLGEKREVYDAMNKGKVFILPSYEEGWGLVVFEAIACGLAPVVYDLPVFNEIFGHSIAKVSLGAFSGFAGKIIKFLQDEKYREGYNSALREIIEPYDLQNIIKKEIELIERVSRER